MNTSCTWCFADGERWNVGFMKGLISTLCDTLPSHYEHVTTMTPVIRPYDRCQWASRATGLQLYSNMVEPQLFQSNNAPIVKRLSRALHVAQQRSGRVLRPKRAAVVGQADQQSATGTPAI
eukprot:COSAG02_NODE_9508_length_2192_cov_1.612518_3_plen_121_part_00